MEPWMIEEIERKEQERERLYLPMLPAARESEEEEEKAPERGVCVVYEPEEDEEDQD